MEFIDDHPVVSHRVRFRNRVEITEDQSRLVKDDNVVVWLVRARCLPPQYHPLTADSEERFRFNVQAVTEAVPLDGAALDQAVAYLDHGDTQAILNLRIPTHPESQLSLDEAVAEEAHSGNGLRVVQGSVVEEVFGRR